MCGRFITGNQSYRARVQHRATALDVRSELQRRPDSACAVIRIQDGQRSGLTMRWGLIPFFAKGEPLKYATINATVEKLDSASAWRGAVGSVASCPVPRFMSGTWSTEGKFHS